MATSLQATAPRVVSLSNITERKRPCQIPRRDANARGANPARLLLAPQSPKHLFLSRIIASTSQLRRSMTCLLPMAPPSPCELTNHIPHPLLRLLRLLLNLPPSVSPSSSSIDDQAVQVVSAVVNCVAKAWLVSSGQRSKDSRPVSMAGGSRMQLALVALSVLFLTSRVLATPMRIPEFLGQPEAKVRLDRNTVRMWRERCVRTLFGD